MNGVETYLVDTALNSDPFRRLGEETNPLQSYQDGYEIWQSLSLPISGNRSLSGMVMFSLLNNQIFSRSGSLFGNTLEQKAQTTVQDSRQVKLSTPHELAALRSQGAVVCRGGAQRGGSGHGLGHVHGSLPPQRLSGLGAGASLRSNCQCRGKCTVLYLERVCSPYRQLDQVLSASQ